MRNICKSTIYILTTLFIAGCAKISEDGANDAARRYFNAWMSLNHPELKATWKGVEQADSNSTMTLARINILELRFKSLSLY